MVCKTGDKKSSGLKYSLGSLLLLVASILSSCNLVEPGLGEKVDITPPVIRVVSPSSNSYVSGDFEVSGTVSDDRAVTSVQVSYTDKNGGIRVKDATITENIWKVLISSNSGNNADIGTGRQKISFETKDASQKKDSGEYFIYVDNNAPVVFISTPSDSGTDLYNSELEIRYEIFEDNEIDSVEFSLWKGGVQVGASLITTTLNGSVIFTGLPSYGLLDLETCEVHVLARDKAGNIAQNYWHNNALSKKLLSNASMPSYVSISRALLGLSGPSTMATWFLGTYGDTLYGPDSTLPQKYITFTYTSKLIPGIQFNTPARASLAENIIGLSSDLEFTISKPKDGSNNLDLDVPTVKIFKLTDSGTIESTINVTLEDTLIPSSPLDYEADDLDNGAKSSVRFVVRNKNSSGIKRLPGSGKYRVEVVAKASSKPVDESNTKSVDFLVSQGVPELSADAGLMSYTSIPKVYTGEVQTSDIITSLSFTLVRFNGESRNTTIASYDSGDIAGSTMTFNAGVWALKDAYTFVENQGVYTFKVSATTSSNSIGETSFNVQYDTEEPETLFGEALPRVGDQTVNGKFNILGTNTDNIGIKNTWWAISTAPPASWVQVPGSLTSVKFIIDTTSTTGNVSVNDQLFNHTFADTESTKIWIKTEDMAGLSRESSKEVTVLQSSDNPTIEYSTIDISATSNTPASARKNLFESSAILRFSLSDDDMVDASSVQIQIDAHGTLDPWLPVTVGPANAKTINGITYDISPSASPIAEGIHSFKLRFSDSNSAKLGLPAATVVSGPYYFMVDRSSPVLTITNPVASNTLTKTGIALAGTAIDINDIDKVEIFYRKDGALPLSLPVTGTTSWTAGLVSPEDGSYEFTIMAFDTNNRASTEKRTVEVDKTAPSITEISNLNTNALLTNASYSVQGIAGDGAGTGVKKVQYRLSSNGGTNWSSWTDAAGNTNWTANLTGLVNSLSYVLEVQVEDNAGNMSASPASETFRVDLAVPVLTETTVNTTSLQYTSGNITLAGASTDSNGIKSVVVSYEKNGGGVLELFNSTSGASSWTTTLPVNAVSHADDGSYAFTILATDNTDRSTTLVRNIIVDTQAPVIVVNSPASNESFSTNVANLSGTISDSGSGVDTAPNSMSYSLNGGAAVNFTPLGSSWTINSVSLGSEGTKTLRVTGKDKLGNTSTTALITFYHDLAAPVLEESTIGSSDTQSTNSGTSSLGGTLDDSNRVQSVSISATHNGLPITDPTVTFTPAGDNKSATWSATPSLTTDGLYVFTITGRDVAGKTHILQRTVRRDTIIPTVTYNAALVTNLTSNWQRSTTVLINGTASDASTGVSLVEWSLDGINYTALTGTTSWSGTVTIPVGSSNILRVRSRDGAGNLSNPVLQTVRVDDTAPAFAITSPSAYSTSTGASSGDTNVAISFGGTLSDNLALAASNYLLVKPKKNGVAQADIPLILTAGNWSWTLAAPADNSADGTWELTFLATDSSGLTTSVTRTIVIETKNPVLTPNLTPSVTDPDKYNGIVAVKASASDDNTIRGLYWQISTVASVPAFTVAEESAISSGAALAGWTQSASATSLNTTWDSSAVGTSGDANRYLWLAAGDRFGNIQTSSTPLVVNQATDRPALTFLNLTVGAAHTANNLGTTLVLNGTITDDDGVDKDKIFIAVAADANQDGTPDTAFSFAAVSGKPAANGKTVSFSQNLGSGGLNLTQGYYVLRLKVGDILYAGTISTESNTGVYSWNQSNIERLMIDTTPPTITINEAQNDFKGATFTLTGTASDFFGLQGGQILVDGAPVTVAGDNSWSSTVTSSVGEGSKSLTVQATDISGQVSNLTYNYRRDSIAPSMTLSTNLVPWQLSTSVALAGTSTDGSGSGIARVEWSIDGTDYFQLNGTNNWSGIATIPNGASNELRLRVTDQAGNTALYDADIGTSGQQNVTVKVDDTNPSFSLDSPVWYTSNSSGDSNASISFSGSLTDNIALGGTPLVVQRKKNNVVQANGASVSVVAGTWSWTMPINDVTNADDGTWELTFVSIDSAGRSTTVTRTVNVETKEPLVTSNLVFSNAARSRYNGIVPVKASISDDNSLIATYWQVSSSATVPGYTSADVRAGDANIGAGWNKSASASNLNDTWDSSAVGVSADATQYLWVIAVDRFGNIAESNTSMVFNQTTDTPIVRFGNINAAGTGLLKRTTIVTGSISDDDGIPSMVEASLDGTTWYDISSTDGSWSFDANPLSLADPDGNKTIRMRVTDAAGKVFTTDLSGGTLAVPTVITWPVAFKVDTQEPAIEQTVNIDLTPAMADSFVELTPSMGLGGVNTGSFLIQTFVNDANAINITSVKVKLIGKDSGGTTRTKTYNTTRVATGTYPASDTFNSGTITINGNITWDDLTVSALADGSATIQIDAEDTSGLKSSRSKTILVDNTAPAIPTISSPNLDQDLTGNVDILGVATDDTSGVADVSYRVGLNAASESWISLGASIAFNISLSGSSNSTSYWVGQPGEASDANSDGIWDLPVEIRVRDKAGNSRIHTITLKVDPAGDLPKVQLVFPYKDGLGNWKALGGSIRLQGTATDNNGIYDITVRIDKNNNGNWTDDGAWSAGVLATGTNFWNLTINNTGEFDPIGVDVDRQITVRVHARDTKNGTLPDVTGAFYEFPVTIDKNVPKIGSAADLQLSKSQVALVSTRLYDFNMNINGAWYLHGSIEDDNNVAEINVYNESGFKIETKASLMADGRLTETSNKRYDLRFPIGVATVDLVDTIVYTLEAVDDTGKITQQQIKFNLDNKAPTMGAYLGNTPVINSASSTYKINAEANNSAINDGWVMDEGTSVDKVEVYLIRRGNGSTTFDRFYKARGKHTDPEWTAILGASTTGKHTPVSGATKTMSDGTTPNYPSDADYVISIDSKTENGNNVIGDADKYVEWLAQTGGTKWSWWVDINAASIPDGPVEIHYVAYDTAGNSKHYSTNTFIQNNGPSVGAIWLGSDLNANGTINYGHDLGTPANTDEEVRYATPTASTSTSFVVKEAPMSIYLEVAQGNGDLVYDLSVSSSAFTRTAQALRTSGTVATITLDATDLALIGDGAKTFTITVWDSTEETTPGTNSLSVSKEISLTTKIGDTIRPTATVRPFYWNSELVNSRYDNSAAEGHIDIALNALGDSDSKVSGKVSFRGTIFDDQRVTAIYAYIGNGTNDTDRYAFTDADATLVSGGLTYARVALLSSGTWALEDNMVSRGWKFAIENEQLDQTGHRIDWRLDWDSSGISGVAVTDRVMRVLTVDKGNNQNLAAASVSTTLSGTATRSNTMSMTVAHNASIAVGQLVLLGSGQQAYSARIAAYNGTGVITLDRSVDTSHTTYTIWLDSHNLPQHQIDVVPYVSSVTRLSTFNTHRARSGAISLRREEAGNTLSGFNFGTAGTANLSITSDRLGATVTTAIGTYTVSTNTTASFTLPANAKDGYLSIVVNGVRSINNMNNNQLESNKEILANRPETTYWNDDRLIRVWQSSAGDVFAGSTNPVFPAMSMDSSGDLYASFSNYSTSMVYHSTIGGTATPVFYTYDPPEETEVIVTGTGASRQINIAYSANYHGGNEVQWAAPSNGAGGLYLYDDSAASYYMGRDNRQAYRFELFYHNRMLQQFKNLRLARASSGGTERIHLVYYDRITNAIKYANINDGYAAPTNTVWVDGANRPVSSHEISWIKLDGGADADDTAAYNDGSSIVLSAARFEAGLQVSSGTGEIAAITLTSTKLPVVLYYDADRNVLKLARASNVNPKGSEALWSVQSVINSGDANAGTVVDYLSAQIDSDNYLHIAFQNSKGELVYLKSTNNPTNGTTRYNFGPSLVLATSAMWTDLTLKGNVPYISYLSRVNSFDGMNMTFYDATLDLDGDSVGEGGWETMTAAMNYKASNVRTSIEAHPTPATGGWTAAIGFTPGNEYRVIRYIGF